MRPLPYESAWTPKTGTGDGMLHLGKGKAFPEKKATKTLILVLAQTATLSPLPNQINDIQSALEFDLQGRWPIPPSTEWHTVSARHSDHPRIARLNSNCPSIFRPIAAALFQKKTHSSLHRPHAPRRMLTLLHIFVDASSCSVLLFDATPRGISRKYNS